jgi:ribosomal protein S27AE
VRRACPVTLKHATDKKRHQIRLLVEAYRGCVNRFIRVLWQMPTEEFGLNRETLALVPAGRLSERCKSNALKQAIEIVVSTRRAVGTTGQKASCPRFTGKLVLDAKFVIVEDKQSSPGNPFDLVVKLSKLNGGRRMVIPTCRTRPLNKWLSRPGARLVQGCCVSENELVVWVEEPEPDIPWTPDDTAVTYGADLGMRKLLTVKNERNQTAFLGREYHPLQQRIGRKKPGSKARGRLLNERDHVIGRTLNALPWRYFDVVGVEDLAGISRGKHGLGRKREFRRKRSPWAHRSVLERLMAKADENRVLLVAVQPRDTSRECPNCRCASELNRKGERFSCIRCGYTEDADGVGAGNVRSRTLEILNRRRRWLESHLESPSRAHLATRRSVASRRCKKASQ